VLPKRLPRIGMFMRNGTPLRTRSRSSLKRPASTRLRSRGTSTLDCTRRVGAPVPGSREGDGVGEIEARHLGAHLEVHQAVAEHLGAEVEAHAELAEHDGHEDLTALARLRDRDRHLAADEE
jgi:hypothetical protein